MKRWRWWRWRPHREARRPIEAQRGQKATQRPRDGHRDPLSGGIPAIQHKLVAMSATILSSLPPMKRQETSHWIRNKVTSSRSGHWLAGSRDWHFHLPTARLSLDKKQGHLFAQWPLATPGHTFTFLHSSTPKQQGSNTWCQVHPPPLYLCRGDGRAHHHHSTFTPPPPDPVSSPPTSSVSL